MWHEGSNTERAQLFLEWRAYRGQGDPAQVVGAQGHAKGAGMRWPWKLRTVLKGAWVTAYSDRSFRAIPFLIHPTRSLEHAQKRPHLRDARDLGDDLVDLHAAQVRGHIPGVDRDTLEALLQGDRPPELPLGGLEEELTTPRKR